MEETLPLGRGGVGFYTCRMFLRCNRRVKDGKSHEYWSVVENRRLGDGRVVQRQVLYLGEINASQREAWRRTIEVQDEGQRRQVALFPTGLMPADAVDAIGVRMSELRLERPRQWGACWLSCVLWQQLELDRVLGTAPCAFARGRTPAAYRLPLGTRLSLVDCCSGIALGWMSRASCRSSRLM